MHELSANEPSLKDRSERRDFGGFDSGYSQYDVGLVGALIIFISSSLSITEILSNQSFVRVRSNRSRDLGSWCGCILRVLPVGFPHHAWIILPAYHNSMYCTVMPEFIAFTFPGFNTGADLTFVTFLFLLKVNVICLECFA